MNCSYCKNKGFENENFCSCLFGVTEKLKRVEKIKKSVFKALEKHSEALKKLADS